MRPQPQPMSFTERVQQIQRFLDEFIPRPDEPTIVAPRPAPALSRRAGASADHADANYQGARTPVAASISRVRAQALRETASS